MYALLSWNVAPNGVLLPFTYRSPILVEINCLKPYNILSGLKALSIHNCWIAVLFFHSDGNFSFSGCSNSQYFFHLLLLCSKSLQSSFKASILVSAFSVCHWPSLIHSIGHVDTWRGHLNK
eukprot:NODE_74_length_23402_cov_1.166974.p8 type:complete len:121 gc:universal NODE_74_length_23402_cov_1.166974:8413-8775(+)